MEIINKTPWTIEGLTDLIVAAASVGSRPLSKITFESHRPSPRVKREDQRVYSCREHGGFDHTTGIRVDVAELTFFLASPTRIKNRTAPLDRMALIKDLRAQDVALPVELIGNIIHAVKVFAKSNYKHAHWPRSKHLRGMCDCYETFHTPPPIIVGDTKARIRPPVSLEQLEKRLRRAEVSVDSCEDKLARAIKKRDKLLVRVERARSKG